jgi:hypothetical protein
LNLCRACIKYAAVPCGLQQLFVWMIPAFMALALIPLTAGVKLAAYRTTILGSAYQYGHPAVYQWFEIRYCPGLALVLLAASWLVLVGQRRDPVPPAKRLFAAALGLLGFSLARLGLFAIYPDRLVWFVFWEEFTEFLLIFSIAAVLWVFRRTLFAHPSPASAPGASVATAAPAEAA